MSNEYKDWIRDENYELCQEYPFLIPRNIFSGVIDEDYDYSYTWLDDCPIGWHPLFLEMCMMIKPILEDCGNLNDFHFIQVKEKYGQLRVYYNGAPKKVDNIINYYEEKSRRVCIGCGEPATKITTGWISPWCDECGNKTYDNLVDIKKWMKEN